MGSVNTHLIQAIAGSWLVRQVSSKPVTFGGQLPHVDQRSYSGNQSSRSPWWVEQSMRRGGGFLPVVSLSFCCAPLHNSSQSGPSGKGGRWRDRKAVGWCHLDWSPAPCPEYDNVHTLLWCRQIIFLIPSSCSPFQWAILPCVFFFLF